MVSLVHLWLPILLSAVVVFFASAIMHMALSYHRKDYKGLPDEDAVRDILRRQNLAADQYMFPYCADMKQMKSPEMTKKFTEGPVGMLTIRTAGMPNMGPYLIQWFLYCVGISAIIAFLACSTVQFGATYRGVFHVVGLAAFLGYSGAHISSGIWLGRPWPVVIKESFDGLVYALLTAGVFGWLWPR